MDLVEVIDLLDDREVAIRRKRMGLLRTLEGEREE